MTNTHATEQIASFALATRFEDLPAVVVKSAKLLMLDTIGCVMGAAATSPGLAVQRVVERQGTGPATVFSTGQKTTITAAAWANGRLANILDYDECYKVQGHHAQSTLSSAFALAEDEGLNGKSLLTSFVVGFEVGVRLGNFLTPRVALDDEGRVKGWTGLVGPGQGVYGACTAASRLMGSDVEQLANAYGVCAQYMAGRDWMQQWGLDPDLGTLKYADTGWNAQGGLMAAWHAREGISSIRNIFDSDSYGEVFQGVLLNTDALLHGLGERWYLPDTSIKFWPSCRLIHYGLTAFSQLVAENDLRAAEIESVDILSFPMFPRWPRFASSGDPPNLVAATFSFAHSAAMIAMRVPPGPDWFSNGHMAGEVAHAIRQKVRIGNEEASFDPKRWGLAEGVVKIPSRAIIKARGREFVATSDFALGDPWQGAPAYSDDDVIEKFKGMARALMPPSDRWESQIGQMVEKVMHLDELVDVRELADVLSVRP